MIHAYLQLVGIHSELLLAGAAGGWLAMTYHQAPISLLGRISRIVLSSLIAAWSVPLVTVLVDLPHSADIVKYPMALVIGLLTMDVLGKGIISMARKWIKNHGNDR